MFESIGQISCINLSENFLKVLNDKSFPERPLYRRVKSQINLSFLKALLLPDYFSEPISCEIKVNLFPLYFKCIIFAFFKKPKWSGLKHKFVENSTCTCRYCLAQLTKNRRLSLSPKLNTIYCPKLLFSNDIGKISQALSDMFIRPSNQFRLSINSFFVPFSNLG